MDLEMLHELCETLTRELEDVNDKISKSGGMSAGDLETVDKLSHALKSIKTTIAMIESDDGYSQRYPYFGMAYADGNRGGSRGGSRGGNSNRGNTYARGRRRDNMGRYSRNGYSYADSLDDLVEELRGMMDDLPDEQKREVQRFVDKMSM